MFVRVSTLIGAVAVGAWVYLGQFHGRYWRVRQRKPRCAEREPQQQKSIVIAVVPARDEADVVANSVVSLLEQDELRRVVLVDDSSSDGTAQVAREAAKAVGHRERLTIVSGKPLPPGWSGKVWAMKQGVDLALAHHPDYLLLTDADIVHEGASVRELLRIAQEGDRDLVSFMAKLHCESVAEKMLIPAFVYFFFKLYPPEWIADQARQTAGAAGGCILIRPEALARAGGIAAIRNEVIDDCALARAVKRSGGRLWLSTAELVRSVRSYSLRDIERMISRSAFNQLRHSGLLLVSSIAGLALLYLAPPWLVSTGTIGNRSLGAAAWAVMTATYLPILRFYRLRPVWALSLPLAAVFYMGATVRSAIRYWCGVGGRWKGRVQDPASA